MLATVVAAAAGQAQAADPPPACGTLANPVYVVGSSAVKPFLAKVAAELGQLATPITVVAQLPGSCQGVNSIVGATPSMLSGTATTFDSAGAGHDCTLASAVAVDIGVSDVYATSCAGVDALPSDVKDFSGPIQGMTFVVPTASTQTVISAEAAYLVYGLGAAGEVSPWTDVMQIQQRDSGSGTQLMIAAYIKVPAAKFMGQHPPSGTGSGGLIAALGASATAGNAEQAIGILATDGADKNRATLRVLGYQHYGQSCAFWPDSTATSFDKTNIRDGHYPIWGPLHMLAKVSGDTVANANAKQVIDYLSGAETPTTFDLIHVEATGGVVPACAMHVARTKDGGELMSFMPEKSCACKFVAEANGAAPSDCQSCEKNEDCPASAPACNYKYCEVR